MNGSLFLPQGTPAPKSLRWAIELDHPYVWDKPGFAVLSARTPNGIKPAAFGSTFIPIDYVTNRKIVAISIRECRQAYRYLRANSHPPGATA